MRFQPTEARPADRDGSGASGKPPAPLLTFPAALLSRGGGRAPTGRFPENRCTGTGFRVDKTRQRPWRSPAPAPPIPFCVHNHDRQNPAALSACPARRPSRLRRCQRGGPQCRRGQRGHHHPVRGQRGGQAHLSEGGRGDAAGATERGHGAGAPDHHRKAHRQEAGGPGGEQAQPQGERRGGGECAAADPGEQPGHHGTVPPGDRRSGHERETVPRGSPRADPQLPADQQRGPRQDRHQRRADARLL